MLCSVDIPERPALMVFFFFTGNGGGVDLWERGGGGETRMSGERENYGQNVIYKRKMKE